MLSKGEYEVTSQAKMTKGQEELFKMKGGVLKDCNFIKYLAVFQDPFSAPSYFFILSPYLLYYGCKLEQFGIFEVFSRNMM